MTYFTETCAPEKLKKSKVHDKNAVIVASSGSERNHEGMSEFASFSQLCGVCSDGKKNFITDAQFPGFLVCPLLSTMSVLKCK